MSDGPDTDRSPVSDDLERRVARLEAGHEKLGDQFLDLKHTIELEGAKNRAAAASETTKLIGSIVLAVVTAIGGSVGVAAIREPTPVREIAQRSAFDRELDACRTLSDDTSRTECILRVARESR